MLVPLVLDAADERVCGVGAERGAEAPERRVADHAAHGAELAVMLRARVLASRVGAGLHTACVRSVGARETGKGRSLDGGARTSSAGCGAACGAGCGCGCWESVLADAV